MAFIGATVLLQLPIFKGVSVDLEDSIREVILKKKLLPFGHCPKVALAPLPPLVLDTFGVTFV